MAFLPFECPELPEEIKERFLSDIGENHVAREMGLRELAERVKEQKDFPSKLDNGFLLRFLRVAKFDVDKAFARLQRFYSVQRSNPDVFEASVESALRKAHLNQAFFSPHRLKDCSMFYIMRFFHTDFSKLSAKEKLYLDALAANECLETETNQRCGVTILMDCARLTFHAMLQFPLRVIKTNFDILTGAFPMRVRGIHVVNPPSIFKVFFNVFHPIMPKKLQKRFYVHSDSVTWKDLHAFIPPEVLPKDYGGHLDESSLIPAMSNIYKAERNFRKNSPRRHS